jgi:hypothetical protein
MATSKETSQPLPPEERPLPGPMPTEGDEVRDIGKRAGDDLKSPRKDTDEAGYDTQRKNAPETSPTKRSGITDGSSG